MISGQDLLIGVLEIEFQVAFIFFGLKFEFLFFINYFFKCFLNYFYVLISKVKFFKKYIIFNIF